MNRRSRILLLLSLTTAALTACTAAPAPIASDASTPGPAPTASESAAVPIETAVADSCVAIDTSEPTVDGTTLGTCISDALHVLGTMKAQQVLDGERQDVELRLRPDVAIHSTSADEEVVFVGGVAYRNDGDGWVEGDPDSDDSEEVTVGSAGELLIAVFAGDILKQSIAACAVWNIETGLTGITLPDGFVVQVRTFTCAAPFDSLGVTVDPMHVWIGEDWTPYGYESTATGYGQVVDGVSYYYDQGVEVDITAPM